MADPLSNMQNSDTMEHDPDNAVQEALKIRKRKGTSLPPSKLASYLGGELLKRAFTTDAHTSAKYGPAADAGIKLRGAKGGGPKMSTGNGWASAQGSNNLAAISNSSGVKVAGSISSLGPDILASLKQNLGEPPTWANTLAQRLGNAGGVGLLGAASSGIIGGVKGMFDDKDEDESRLMHMLKSTGGGALMGGGAGVTGSLASQYAPELMGAAKNKLHEVTAAEKLAALHSPAVLAKLAAGSPTAGPMGMGPGSAGMGMGAAPSGTMGSTGAAPGPAMASAGAARGSIGGGAMLPGTPGAPPGAKGPAAGGMLMSGGGQMGGLKMK